MSPQVFNHKEYIIGDSAYAPRPFLIPAYKKPIGSPIDPGNESFNGMLSKARVTSEHTIGMLKNRFPCLRSIRLQLKPGAKHLKIIINHIRVCIVLHNLLIGYDDVEDVDNNDDDLSDIDADNEMNQSLPVTAPTDSRRTQLKNYMLETFYV